MNTWRRFPGGPGGRPGLGAAGTGHGPVGSAPTVQRGAHQVTRADSEPEATAAVRPDQQGRILTVPNAISVARLAGVPVFLWLVLGPQADGWAVALLIAAGLSDWLDGVIARAWNQQSRLGQVLEAREHDVRSTRREHQAVARHDRRGDDVFHPHHAAIGHLRMQHGRRRDRRRDAHQRIGR